MIFYVEFTNTPWFFVRNKRYKRRRTFFERGSNSLKRTYVEIMVEGRGGGGVHVKRTGTNKKRRGVKNWKFWANVLFEWPHKQKEKFMTMIQKFKVTKSTVIFKINIVKLIDKYSKLMKSSVTLNFYFKFNKKLF